MTHADNTDTKRGKMLHQHFPSNDFRQAVLEQFTYTKETQIQFSSMSCINVMLHFWLHQASTYVKHQTQNSLDPHNSISALSRRHISETAGETQVVQTCKYLKKNVPKDTIYANMNIVCSEQGMYDSLHYFNQIFGIKEIIHCALIKMWLVHDEYFT